jgi:hypothetical protein
MKKSVRFDSLLNISLPTRDKDVSARRIQTNDAGGVRFILRRCVPILSLQASLLIRL